MESRALPPKTITIKLSEEKPTCLVETKEHDIKIKAGMSEKTVYKNEKNNIFYVAKQPKPRNANTVFKFTTSTSSAEQHLKDLYLSATFNEVVAPMVAKALFGDAVAVPENYLHIDEKRMPTILSKQVKYLNEFLEQRKMMQGKKTPNDWSNIKKLPVRADLELTSDEAIIIGKLYAIALITNHWDIFNNINMANAGYITNEKNELIPTVIDWGNVFHIGFVGLTCDENTLEIKDDFNNAHVPHPSELKKECITGFTYSIPFDSVPFPYLPRQLVADLFLMGEDEIGKAIFQGFANMIEIAAKKVRSHPNIIQETINKSFDRISYDKNCEEQFINVKKLKITNINRYFFGIFKPKNENDYTLENILKERIEFLDNNIHRFRSTESIQQMAEEILGLYRESQRIISLLPERFLQGEKVPEGRMRVSCVPHT